MWAHLQKIIRPTTRIPPTVLPAPFPTGRVWQLLELFFLLADCLYLPEWLLLLNRVLKCNTRPLNERELALAQSIFGSQIRYQDVRMDERAYLGCKHYRFAYVGFSGINTWGALSDPHFIHELVHVWQYERVGSVYIPRALHAQYAPAGYDYGGPAGLQSALNQGATLHHFNYEQQGDIVADYFCLLYDLPPRFCPPDRCYLPLFEAILVF